MCVRRAFRYFPEIHLFYTWTINLWLGAFPTDGLKSCVCSAPWWFTAHCTCWICMWTYHCFPFTTKIMLNMLWYMHFGTVNSLVSDYPWFTTKWSLTGGCHLWEKKRRISQISAPRRGCGHIRNLRGGCLQETFWSCIYTKCSLMGGDFSWEMVTREMTV